jgi:mannose-6-phosphate isomerase-like protein (cupin superfamily)
MAKQGQTIKNKLTGETITWMATSKDTKGEYLELSLKVDPHGATASKHIHPNQDEHFVIKKGVIKMEIDKETRMLFPGQSITVPKGVAHQWVNPSDSDELVMELRFTPALETEVFFEQFFGLCNDDKNNPDGSFKFWQIITSVKRFDIFTAAAPVSVQKALATILSPIARLIGYKAVYEKYSM